MGIITKMLQFDTCVYWALRSAESGGLDYDDYGQPQHTDPIEIKCRWEVVAVEYIDPKGTTRTSKSVVYVDRDVDVGGMLFHGELSEVTEPDSPREQEGAWEIMQFAKLPKLNYSKNLRTCFL